MLSNFSNKTLSALSLQVSRIGCQPWSTEGSAATVWKLWRRYICHYFPPGQTAGSPDAAVDDNSDSQTIRTALLKLCPLDREALLQQIRFGRSIAAIAVRLQLSETEVRTLLVRARRRMRLLCGEDVSLDPTP
jgi:DNA-directed RNA polymerase specialized sigma24 family protein